MSTSSPWRIAAVAIRAGNRGPSASARAAAPAVSGATNEPAATGVAVVTQIRGSAGYVRGGTRWTTLPRAERSHVSAPRWRIATGVSATTVRRSVCGKARS